MHHPALSERLSQPWMPNSKSHSSPTTNPEQAMFSGPLLGLLMMIAALSSVLLGVSRMSSLSLQAMQETLAILMAACLIALASAVLLKLFSPLLSRMPQAAAMFTAFCLLMLVAHLVSAGLYSHSADPARLVEQLTAYWQTLLAVQVTVVVTVNAIALLTALKLRGQVSSAQQSSQAANLQALQSRIRPHFMFNSMNSIAGLIRNNPELAEHALHDLADLIRVLMADARKLVPLTAEIETSRQYLQIEKMRLGERLAVKWHIDKIPKNCQVPSLILQPLLENAVYHGIETNFGGGLIDIDMRISNNKVHIVIRNPLPDAGGDRHSKGNKIAMDNIRERLKRHFNDRASLKVQRSDGIHITHVVLPLVTNG
jgi:two-component system sensor histidine kinase AlgZ